MERMVWKPSVAAVCLKWDGVAYYRAALPFQELQDQGKAVFLSHQRLYDADVVLFERVFLPPFSESVADLKRRGGKIIYGMDDDPFDVPAHHPSYATYQSSELKQRLAHMLRSSDLVIASTEHLKKALHEHLGSELRINVIGNYLDFKSAWNIGLLKSRGPLYKPYGKIVIGWAGSPLGHKADLDLLRGVFRDLVQRYRDKVLFRFMGYYPEYIVTEIPTDHVEFQPWVDVSEYPKTLYQLGFDIGLIPLEDNPHNRSKTNLKFLEFSALGIPSVVSRCGPYRSTPSGCALLVENEHDAWLEAIVQLIEDETRRIEMGDRAWSHVRRNYDIADGIHLWAEALSSLKPDSKQTPREPVDTSIQHLIAEAQDDMSRKLLLALSPTNSR